MFKLLIISPSDAAAGLGDPSCEGVIDTNLPDGNLTQTGLTSIRTTCTAHAGSRAGYDAVVSCANVQEFLTAVTTAGKGSGPISLLDIVGHGAGGLQKVGSERLLEASERAIAIGGDLPSKLLPHLAQHARIRLLGCNTGRDLPGRILLAKLGLLFRGAVTVYGTIDRVIPAHFESGEFSQAQELLFSSEAALDRMAPAWWFRAQTLRAFADVHATA
jgi:hypothetical protein